jgi:hypothetical protein
MSENSPNADEIPLAIADDETIVRALLTPVHVKKGKVKKAAFRPRPGQSAISVMRQIMGDDSCKDKAVEIGAAAKPKNEYLGLLTIRTDAIRQKGSTVTDSRDEFLGHADLDHGFPQLPADEPAATPDELQKMDDRIDALIKASVFRADQSPEQSGWSGTPLKIP